MDRRIFAAMAFAGLLAGCASTPTISSDTTPGASLHAYGSYVWGNTHGPADMNPVAFERIRQGVDRAMSAKGFHKSTPGDITLIVTVGAKDMQDVTTWGRFCQGLSVYNYTEGKLSIDLFDTKTGHALWHGQAEQTIEPGRTEPAKVDAAVAAVMAQLPAKG